MVVMTRILILILRHPILAGIAICLAIWGAAMWLDPPCPQCRLNTELLMGGASMAR
jgi:hypothetical protein